MTVDDLTQKICSKCKVVKILIDFAIDRRLPSGRQGTCRLCQKLHNISCSRVAQRKYRLKHVYGLSLEDYDNMYERQAARCQGCNNPIDKYGKSTHVDHNHKTGIVRGLLCHSCNSSLGYSKEDEHRLRGLIHYLEYKAA